MGVSSDEGYVERFPIPEPGSPRYPSWPWPSICPSCRPSPALPGGRPGRLMPLRSPPFRMPVRRRRRLPRSRIGDLGAVGLRLDRRGTRRPHRRRRGWCSPRHGMVLPAARRTHQVARLRRQLRPPRSQAVEILEFVHAWWEARCLQRLEGKDDDLERWLWEGVYDWQQNKIDFLEAHGYRPMNRRRSTPGRSPSTSSPSPTPRTWCTTTTSRSPT